MSKLGSWIGRHRVAAGFAAGALLTLIAVAVVGYVVLADQRRTARVLAAALSQALARDVRIDRVTELNPSRVVMKGIRLSKERGWPADITAESVEASGPLLDAARGGTAPVRLQVTRPTITVAGGGAAGAAAVEGLRQGLATFLTSAAILDLGVTGGVLEVPGTAPEGLTFDATLHKGTGEARGEVLLRDRAGRAARAHAGRAARGGHDPPGPRRGGSARPTGSVGSAGAGARGRDGSPGPAGPGRPRAGRSPRGAPERPAGGSRDLRGDRDAPRRAPASRRAAGHRGSRVRRRGGGPDRSGPRPSGAHRWRGLLGAGARRMAERARRPAPGGRHRAGLPGRDRGPRPGPRDASHPRATRGPRRRARGASRRSHRRGRRRAGPGGDHVARGPRARGEGSRERSCPG